MPLLGFAQQKVRCPLSAVGAVYDRAFVPLDCENCAVIDRAYSKKVCVCVLLCKAPSWPGWPGGVAATLSKISRSFLDGADGVVVRLSTKFFRS